MLSSSSSATIATAPKCSTTSRVAVAPPGMRTSSARSAKILPLCTSREETVSKTCSATGRGLFQQGLPGAVGVVFRDFHRKPFGGLVVDGRTDERHEQRMGSGGPALQFGMGLGADQKRVDLRG